MSNAWRLQIAHWREMECCLRAEGDEPGANIYKSSIAAAESAFPETKEDEEHVSLRHVWAR